MPPTLHAKCRHMVSEVPTAATGTCAEHLKPVSTTRETAQSEAMGWWNPEPVPAGKGFHQGWALTSCTAAQCGAAVTPTCDGSHHGRAPLPPTTPHALPPRPTCSCRGGDAPPRSDSPPMAAAARCSLAVTSEKSGRGAEGGMQSQRPPEAPTSHQSPTAAAPAAADAS
jgi:hypothetical protein